MGRQARHILRAPVTSGATAPALAAVAQRAQELLPGSARRRELVELNYTISQPGAPAQAPHSDISPLQSVPRGRLRIWPGSHLVAKDFIRKLPKELQKPRHVPEYMYIEGQLQAVSRTGHPTTEEQLEEERRESFQAAEALLQLVTQAPKEIMAMAAGDVVAMDCRVFHRGGANVSDATRVLMSSWRPPRLTT
eukprot:Skav202618  [mRNA]  locus=scaffold3002:284219:295192:+ [translate_table: standard]